MAERWTRLSDRLGLPLLIAAGTACAVLAATSLLAPLLLGANAAAIQPADALQPAGAEHWLGTDELGRDILLRTLVATRLSLGLSIAATFLGAALGIVIGSLPSVTSRWTGRLIAAVINLALAFPALLLALFVAAVLGAGMYSAVLAISLAITPIFARLTYTLAASIRDADHVSAARLLGVGSLRILWRHVLPMISGPLLVTTTIGISGALLVLSGLSFLGLGVQPPYYDWGVLLAQGLNRIYVSPASSLAPATAIVLTGLMLATIGEAVALWTGVRAPRRMPVPARIDAETGDADDSLISVHDLRVAFGGSVAVRGVSFAMKEGERVGLVGESGSGKTLSALACAALPISGADVRAAQLSFEGESIGRPADEGLRRFLGTRMAFVFQDPLGSFNPVVRIGSQLAELAQEHLDMPRREALKRATDRLASVGLSQPERCRDSYPHELSGGMLQRSMIGLGLMAEPRLIIADEPTTALDVTVQKRVLDLIEDVCASTGAGLLLISHDLAVVARSCDRVLVMYAGRIVEDVSVATLQAGPAHPYSRALRDSVLDLDTRLGRKLPTIAGAPPAAGTQIGGCAFAPRCSRASERCRDQAPELLPISLGHRVACWNPVPCGATA